LDSDCEITSKIGNIHTVLQRKLHEQDLNVKLKAIDLEESSQKFEDAGREFALVNERVESKQVQRIRSLEVLNIYIQLNSDKYHTDKCQNFESPKMVFV
jgi:hypothetical protein